MASTMEASFLEVARDDGAWAVVCVGAPVIFVKVVGFGLDDTVNSLLPRGSGVMA